MALQPFSSCDLRWNTFASLYVLISEGCLKCQKLSRIQSKPKVVFFLQEVDLKECCRQGKSYWTLFAFTLCFSPFEERPLCCRIILSTLWTAAGTDLFKSKNEDSCWVCKVILLSFECYIEPSIRHLLSQSSDLITIHHILIQRLVVNKPYIGNQCWLQLHRSTEPQKRPLFCPSGDLFKCDVSKGFSLHCLYIL